MEGGEGKGIKKDLKHLIVSFVHEPTLKMNCKHCVLHACTNKAFLKTCTTW